MAAVIATVVATDPVLLGGAADFTILTKTGISTAPTSTVTGDIGVSPIAASAITGFDLTAYPSNVYSTSVQIKGRVYAANYAIPTPSLLTKAIGDMETAYTDAAGRALSSKSTLNIQSGLISGTTFGRGVYKWGSDVMFSSDIYITGSSEDIFIFQTTGNLVVGSGANIFLVEGVRGGGMPKASNIVWQVAGYLSAGTTAHLEGTFLVKTHAVFQTGSSLNGRILSQTACTLDSATITQPSNVDSVTIEEPPTTSTMPTKNSTKEPTNDDQVTIENAPIADTAATKEPPTVKPVTIDQASGVDAALANDPSTTEATPTDSTLDGDTDTTNDPLTGDTVPTKNPSTDDTETTKEP